MTPFDLYDAMATRLRDIPELRDNVRFPRPNVVEFSPLAIVANGMPRNNATRGIQSKFSAIQEWDVVPVVRVLVDTNGEAPRERELLLKLLPKIVDAFDTATQGPILTILPSLGSRLKSLSFTDFDEGEIKYNASQNCYALDVYFHAQFTRVADAIPIGGAV